MAGEQKKVTILIAAEDAWSQTMQELKFALAMLPQETLDTMRKTNAAFAQLKIKSSLDIEHEKNKLRAAFEQIKSDGTSSAHEIQQAWGAYLRELNKLAPQMAAVGQKTTATVGGINTVLGSMAQYVAAAFSVTAIVGFVKESFNAAMQVDSINSKLKVMTGSSAGAAQEWEFIRSEAKRLGLDLQQTAESYSSFALATKNTSIEGKKARDVFSALSEAATAMHLPAEQSARVLYQFQQMLSKGKVNMEDLKTASESFPGLLQMIADSLGITTSQLMAQMQAGTLMTDEMLPKLAERLHATFGKAATEAADKGRAALNNFKTAVFEFKAAFYQASGDGGALPFLTSIMENLREFIPIVQQAKIWWGSLIDKFSAWNNTGGLIGLMKGGPQAVAELKAEFAAIDQLTEHAWNNTLNIGKQGAQKQENEEIRNSQRRRDAAKKTGEDLAKINLDYAKAAGGSEVELTAAMEKEYQERLKVAKAYYDQKKAAAKDDDEEIAWEKRKTNALKQLAMQHARDSEIINARMVQTAVDQRKEGLQEEISAIKKQAADRVITEQQAEMKITALTVAAVREQYLTRLYTASKIAAIYGKDSAAYKGALKEQQTSHRAYIDTNLTAYKKYCDEIKALDKAIADFRLSIQEKVRDLKQKGMTDEQKYADDLKRFNEALALAETARTQKKYDEALKFNKQAEGFADRLADTQVKGIDGVKAATEALQKVEKSGVDIREDQKKESQEALDKLKQIADLKLDPKNLEINLDAAALSRVQSEIEELTKPSIKTIFIEYVKKTGAFGEASFSDSIIGMATGGRVGGSGTGDNQLRLLDPREHVIRPEATAFWGDGLLAAFNAPWSAAGRMITARLAENSRFVMPDIPMPPRPSFAMAEGGPVGFGPGVVDMGSVTLNFGGGSYPVMGKIDVINELKTALRREALTRPQ